MKPAADPLWRLPSPPNPPHRHSGEIRQMFELDGFRVEYAHHHRADGSFDQAVHYWRVLPGWEMLATPTSVPQRVREEAQRLFGPWVWAGKSDPVSVAYWEWVRERLSQPAVK